MSKMSKQIANQANAQKSTGPLTSAGKARSAMNSRTHGLCAKDILIGPEEQGEYDEMAEGYLFELDPDGPVEQTLFNEIVGAAWQLGRVQRMEAEACAGKNTYAEMLDDEVLQKKLDRLARHHTRIERTFHRCLKQLKSLQKDRLTPYVKYTTKEIDDKLRRLNESALLAISERTQSAAHLVPVRHASACQGDPRSPGACDPLPLATISLWDQSARSSPWSSRPSASSRPQPPSE